MKLAKRISIALLAACVVGGSALAMTACGGGSEPTDSPSSAVETPVSSDEESQEEAVAFRDAYANGTAYLAGYTEKPFDEANFNSVIQNRMNDPEATITGNHVKISNNWEEQEDSLNSTYLTGEDWSAPNIIIDRLSSAEEMDLGIYDYVNWDAKDALVSERVVLYFTYDELNQTMQVEKLILGTMATENQVLVYEGEEAHNKMIDLLDQVESQNNTGAAESVSSDDSDDAASVPVNIDYSGAYLTAYSAKPFQSALDQAIDLKYGSDGRLSDYEILWYSDWEQLDQISVAGAKTSWLKDEEVPVSCSVSLDWDDVSGSDPQSFHIYLGYNATENTLRVVKLNIHYANNQELYEKEGAYNTLLQYLKVLG